MKNLAEINDADTYILKELEESGIEIISGNPVIDASEVSYSITGELKGWEFTRRWCYWEAIAKDSEGFPLQIATQLNNKSYPKNAQVDESFGSFEDDMDTYGEIIDLVGYENKPPACRAHPDDRWLFLEDQIWVTKLEETGEKELNYDKIAEMYNEYFDKNPREVWSQTEGCMVPYIVKIPPQFIKHYKIGTQEGLNEFARVVKSL